MSPRLCSPWVAFGIGALLALLASVFVGLDEAAFGDADAYLSAAEAISRGQPYPRLSTVGDNFFRAPGYPLLIALTWLVAPDSIAAIKVMNALIFGLLCVIIYAIGWRVSRNRRIALAAALLIAANPMLLVMATDVQTEVPHAALVAASVLCVLLATERGSLRWSALAGFCLGWGALVRPSTLPVGLALLAGWLVWQVASGLDRRPALGQLGVAAAVMAGVLLPWTASNYLATGGLLPVTDADGFSLWLGNHPLDLEMYQGRLQAAEHTRIVMGAEYQRAIELGGGPSRYQEMSIPERSAFWRASAWGFMMEDPWRAAQLWLYKAWGFWQPWLQPFGYARPVVIVSGIVMTGLYSLAVPGAVLAWRRPKGRTLVALVIFLALAGTAVHMVSLSSVRYRLPFLDPFFTVFAALTLGQAWEAIGRRRRMGAA